MEVTIREQELRKIILKAFNDNGLKQDDACIAADNLIEADKRGIHSHGVIRTENYIKKLQLGAVNPNANIRIVNETPISALMDGDNGLGSIVGMKASDLCRVKAEENGIGIVVVRNSNHYGASSIYCDSIAKNDMIAFSASNVEPIMSPPGASEVAIGNNPFCLVAPSGKYHNFCSDMATSQIAWGKVIDFKLNHKKLPGKWAIDEMGMETDDPEKAVFLMPIGLHKGYGIAAQIEVVTSILAGGAFGSNINGMYRDIEKPNSISHIFMALKIECFRNLNEFKEDMDRFMEYLWNIKTNTGQSIVVPGEIENRNKLEAEKDGIQLSIDLLKDLVNITYGVLTDDPVKFIKEIK